MMGHVTAQRLSQFLPVFGLKAETTKKSGFTTSIRVVKREQVVSNFSWRNDGIWIVGQLHILARLRRAMRDCTNNFNRLLDLGARHVQVGHGSQPGWSGD